MNSCWKMKIQVQTLVLGGAAVVSVLFLLTVLMSLLLLFSSLQPPLRSVCSISSLTNREVALHHTYVHSRLYIRLVQRKGGGNKEVGLNFHSAVVMLRPSVSVVTAERFCCSTQT